MAYATAPDVAVRLGRQLEPTTEVPQVNALIADASAFVNVYCRRLFNDPIPGDVTAVVCAEVIRAMNSTPGIVNEQVGDVQTEYVPTITGLSDTAKEALEHYRARIVSLQLQGNERYQRPSYPFDSHMGIWP